MTLLELLKPPYLPNGCTKLLINQKSKTMSNSWESTRISRNLSFTTKCRFCRKIKDDTFILIVYSILRCHVFLSMVDIGSLIFDLFANNTASWCGSGWFCFLSEWGTYETIYRESLLFPPDLPCLDLSLSLNIMDVKLIKSATVDTSYISFLSFAHSFCFILGLCHLQDEIFF